MSATSRLEEYLNSHDHSFLNEDYSEKENFKDFINFMNISSVTHHPFETNMTPLKSNIWSWRIEDHFNQSLLESEASNYKDRVLKELS